MSERFDSVAFFSALASEMNAHPERFTILGDADMSAAIVMRRAGGDLRVGLRFEGLSCVEVGEVSSEELGHADYQLVGDLDAWDEMFDDIVANGAATGRLTINSLALLGERIVVAGDDPMGLDKFSRFNQTLQEFLDGASRLRGPVTVG